MKIDFVKSITTSTNINSDQISSSSLMNIEKRSIYLRKLNYKKIEEKYNKLVVNSLMSNGKCHIVAVFKDYLIEDDHSEFLRRFYTKNESNPRLKKLYDYYEETSVIFPNYTPLIEAKYIYKNIMKKQKVIDEQQDLEDKQNYEKTHKIKNEILRKKDCVFDTFAYDEILNQSESILRIIFGINKKPKKKNDDNKCIIQFPDDYKIKKENRLDTSNDNNNENENSSIENIKKIEDIINNISKFDEINKNKSKIKLSLTNNIKNKLKLTLTNNNNNNNNNNNINTNLITISTNNNNISTSYNKTNSINNNHSTHMQTKTSSKGKKNLKKLKNTIKIENNNNYDYKLKYKPTVLRIPIKSLSPTLKYSHTKNNESNISTNSRNLRNNFTISSKSNRTNTQSLTNRKNYNNNNNNYNHNYNLSMTKINIEPKKISKTKLINFCSIDLNKNFGSNSNNNMLKTLFISNLSNSPNSSNNNNNNNNNVNINNNNNVNINNNKINKYHTKVRSVIGRNSMNFNNSEFFKTFTNNSKKNCRKSNNLIFENGAVTERKTNQKSKKTFHIKKLEELMNKNKNLIFHNNNNNNGYYTERYVKRKENKKK